MIVGEVQVLQARQQIQAAIVKTNPSPPAKYLVESAAACLEHSLVSSNQGFTIKPTAWALVATTVKKRLPAVKNLLEKLHGPMGQKCFRLLGTTPSGEPEFVTIRLGAMIVGYQRAPVERLLACIHDHDPLSAKESSSCVPSSKADLPQAGSQDEVQSMMVRALQHVWHV